METHSGLAQGHDAGLSAAIQPPPARRAAGLRAAGRPPRCTGCQVCGASLEGAKSRFYKRYHICYAHMAASAVEVAGELQRFCQQCGRFHPLDSFDGDMRSCRRQLARHAERRRAARAAAAAAKRGAAQSSPGSSQAAGSGSEGAALLPPVCAAPASPTPADASAAVVNVSLSQQAAAAAVDHLPQPKDDPQSRELPQAQASGSESGSSSLGCSQGVPRSSSPSGGLDALLAAAEEEEAAERQAAAERRAAAEQRGTSKRRAVELGGQQELPAPKRPTSAPPPEEWFAPPLAATWPAPSKPASPMPDAAVLSSLSEQTSLAAAPAPLLPPLLPLASLPPLPALPTPALVGPMAAAMASLGASLQLLQQQHAFMPHIAGLPVPPGTGLEAYVAGLASMAAERIVAELLTASQR